MTEPVVYVLNPSVEPVDEDASCVGPFAALVARRLGGRRAGPPTRPQGAYDALGRLLSARGIDVRLAEERDLLSRPASGPDGPCVFLEVQGHQHARQVWRVGPALRRRFPRACVLVYGDAVAAMPSAARDAFDFADGVVAAAVPDRSAAGPGGLSVLARDPDRLLGAFARASAVSLDGTLPNAVPGEGLTLAAAWSGPPTDGGHAATAPRRGDAAGRFLAGLAGPGVTAAGAARLLAAVAPAGDAPRPAASATELRGDQLTAAVLDALDRLDCRVVRVHVDFDDRDRPRVDPAALTRLRHGAAMPEIVAATVAPSLGPARLARRLAAVRPVAGTTALPFLTINGLEFVPAPALRDGGPAVFEVGRDPRHGWQALCALALPAEEADTWVALRRFAVRHYERAANLAPALIAELTAAGRSRGEVGALLRWRRGIGTFFLDAVYHALTAAADSGRPARTLSERLDPPIEAYDRQVLGASFEDFARAALDRAALQRFDIPPPAPDAS